jgi:hypothetical protein
MAGRDANAVDQDVAPGAQDRRPQWVAQPGPSTTCCDDHVGRAAGDGCVQVALQVRQPQHRRGRHAQRCQPRRERRAERIADQPERRSARGHELVAEQQDVGTGRRDDGQAVVAGGRRQPHDGRGEPRTSPDEQIAGAGLLARAADVRPALHGLGRRPDAERVPVGVLDRQHGVRPRRDDRPGSDGGALPG